ncbi:hypothetical protein K503DRAFT_768562 [Rhizopogon vinicolor AM-OR11-026]|uniref:J domain-containing protein n=1 Tax=Rhizopogon vinicolor AM-OR11-026 TaxID=1314800 RepID=A0A1B7N6H4_9AGAM|nr:hypothetical protein K503DRAFT_768562 [Rhizopogon vinicolor AM-OR11-026]
MATLFPNPTESSTIPSAADFEPDEQWKSRLKVDIENNLRSMVNEAKQSLQDTLKKAPVSAVERERLAEEHLATMKNIRNLAEEQFRIALERERQERRWAAGQTLDQEWSESMIKEQQAILDKIERERKDKAAQSSSSSSQPTAGTSESHTSGRPAERATWTPQELPGGEHEVDYFPRLANRETNDDHVLPRDTGKARAGSVSSGVGSYKPPSTLDTTDRDFERPKPSPTIDELEDMPRSVRLAMDVPDSIRRGGLRRKASLSTRQIPEFWVPSITPEEDAQMSRTFSMARRGSTASATSYRAPSVLNIPFSAEPHDMIERERDRISAVEQEWSGMDRARDRERTTSYTHSEARVSATSIPQRPEERYPPPLTSSVAPSPSSTIPIGYPRPSETSRPHAPPPSASRPIATKKSFSFDDGSFQSSPSPTKGWNGPSRSPFESRYESSRSPQTPEEVPRSWQSSNLRARLSSQDMRYGYNSAESGYYPRPVHTHHEVSEGEYDEDLDDADWREYDDRKHRQREDSFRKREEEVARRELELKRREEEVRREEEAKQKEIELKRKEEETRRKEDEIRRKEEEALRRQEEAERKEEEAQRKELEIRRKEEEARKKEEETRRKEDEIRRKETAAKKKEEEVRRKEAQAKKRAEDLRRQEEEVAKRLDEEARRVEQDILRKSEEATRKENEVRRKEEEARLKEEAARAKEEEIRRKEEELARREEELLRREAEAIRRSDDKQKVQQEEFRRREEEIRRQRAEEKKKQERWDWEAWGYYPPEPSRPTPPPPPPPPPQMSTSQSSSSSTGPWPIPGRPERNMSATSPPTDRNSSGSTSTSRSSATWTASSRPSSTTSSQPPPSTPKPPTPSAQQNAKVPPGPPHTPMSESEFHRRQAEQAQQREEQFRREQARLEQERLAKAGKILNKQDIIKLFENHRAQWDRLQTSTALKWDDFPWPVFKQPSGPDDVTTPSITAYMLSPLHPVDKTSKDRIKENIRRWHPDRFETQLLAKVKESDRDGVREAAGTVVRTLNDLLRSSNQEL